MYYYSRYKWMVQIIVRPYSSRSIGQKCIVHDTAHSVLFTTRKVGYFFFGNGHYRFYYHCDDLIFSVANGSRSHFYFARVLAPSNHVGEQYRRKQNAKIMIEVPEAFERTKQREKQREMYQYVHRAIARYAWVERKILYISIRKMKSAETQRAIYSLFFLPFVGGEGWI